MIFPLDDDGPDGAWRARVAADRGGPPNYDALIDAEREALAREGQDVGMIALIKAVRSATGLGLKESKDAVDGYFARRTAGALEGRGEGWIDGLIDAERAAAGREDRPVTKITLIKAVRSATRLGLKESKDAVEDYLRRRGGDVLLADPGPVGWLFRLLIVAAAIVAGYFAWPRF